MLKKLIGWSRNSPQSRNAQVHYPFHVSLPLIPSLSRIIPVHTLPFYSFILTLNITPTLNVQATQATSFLQVPPPPPPPRLLMHYVTFLPSAPPAFCHRNAKVNQIVR